MTWHVARDYSESIGGHLARIESLNEYMYLQKTLLANRTWVDGTDEINEGNWRFSDGAKVNFSNMHNLLDSNLGGHYLMYEGGRPF